MVGGICLLGTIVCMGSVKNCKRGGVGLGVSGRSLKSGRHGREQRVSYWDERVERASWKIGLVGRFELDKGSVIN